MNKKHRYDPEVVDNATDQGWFAMLVAATVIILIFSIVAGLIPPAIPQAFFGLLVLLPWAVWGYGVTHHEGYGMKHSNLSMYKNYNKLSAESRASIPLTMKDIKDMDAHSDEFWAIEKKLNQLHRAEYENQKAEAKLNSRNKDVINAITARINDIESHTEELERVSDKVDKELL
jgi:hypothetical protein